MNPLIAKSIGSLVRTALSVSVGAWLVSRGVWTDAQATEYLTAFAAIAVPTAWSLWEKYQAARTQNTTIAVLNRLTGPDVDNVTAKDIADVIKQGDAAPAMTPKNAAPVLTGTGDGMRLIRNVTGTGNGG